VADRALDRRGRVADELGDVLRRDDHRVHPPTLELEHLLAREPVRAHDRELPGGNVGEQVERMLEVAAGQQEDLGIEQLERALELFLVCLL
jgi:hypothetical protein